MNTVNNRYTAIITTYNSEKTIAAALQSALSQANPPAEVIVVDDCSVDTTVFTVRKISNGKVPIRLFINETNRGQSWGRNFAAAKSQTDFLVFFDDDDVSLPERSSIHFNHFLNGSEISYTSSIKIYSDTYEVKNINRDITFQNIEFEKAFKLIFLGIPLDSTFKVFVPSSTLGTSKMAYMRMGGFDETLRRLEDMDFFLKSVQHQFQIAWSDSVAVKRFHSSGNDKDLGQDSIYEEILIDRYRETVNPRLFRKAQALGKLRQIFFSRQYARFFTSSVKHPQMLMIVILKTKVIIKRLIHERSIRG